MEDIKHWMRVQHHEPVQIEAISLKPRLALAVADILQQVDWDICPAPLLMFLDVDAPQTYPSC